MKLLKTFCRPFEDQVGSIYSIVVEGDKLLSLPESPASTGQALTDIATGKTHLLLSTESISWKDRTAYYEHEVLQVNTFLKVSRFSTGSRNDFGRPAAPEFTVVAASIPTHLEASNSLKNVLTSDKDGIHDARKFRAIIPTIDVKPGDRVTTDQQETFQVEATDRYTLSGLIVLSLGPDSR